MYLVEKEEWHLHLSCVFLWSGRVGVGGWGGGGGGGRWRDGSQKKRITYVFPFVFYTQQCASIKKKDMSPFRVSWPEAQIRSHMTGVPTTVTQKHVGQIIKEYCYIL